MNGDITEIHTGLYSDKAFKLLLHMVAAQITLRPWGVIMTQFKSMNVERTADGEVIFTPDADNKSYFYNRIWGKSNNEALKWIAIYIKQLVRNFSSCWVNEKIDDICWDRANTDDKVRFVIDPTLYYINDKQMFNDMFKGKESKFSFTVPVRDVYFIYDKFMLREGLDKKYPSKMVDEYVGQPNDPITTELEIAKRQEFKRLEDELNKDLNDLQNEYDKEERKLDIEHENKTDELANKFDKKRNARRQKYQDDLEALIKSYDLSKSEAA